MHGFPSGHGMAAFSTGSGSRRGHERAGGVALLSISPAGAIRSHKCFMFLLDLGAGTASSVE
jgi:hypothetical protein